MIALMHRDDFGRVKDRFRAEKFAMNLGERDSTATITIGPEAPEIIIGDILRDESEPGAGIFWRVSKVETAYNTATRTVSCNHVISMLKEKLLFGEHTTATVANKKNATTCSAKQAMRYVLSFQRDFELNEFPRRYESVSNAYSFNGDTLFSAMETISDTLDDCWWEYDLRTYPFKINIRDRQQAGVETELRLSRNIQNAKLSVERPSFTVLFPIGKNDLHLSEKYVSLNTNLYGMICATKTEATKETESDLRDWANTQLKYGAQPIVTVTVSALDLSKQTGEPLDHIMLGGICRMPLPGFGTTIIERINKMSWSDKIKDPNNISVTMANTRKTASTIISETISSTSKSSRSTTSNYSKGILDIDLRDNEKDKNKHTLWKQDYKGVWKDVATFSSAVASWAVSATGDTVKVTAKPQDQSKNIYIKAATGTWSGNVYRGYVQYSEDRKTWRNIPDVTYSVNAKDRYDAGWRAAYNKVNLPTAEVTNINSILIKTPPARVDGAAVSRSYILTSHDKNNVDLQTKVGSDYVTVARLNHGRYNVGWTNAYNKVSLPVTENTSINSILIKTPPSTVDGAAVSRSYIMANHDDNHTDLLTLVDGTYVAVAQFSHGKYNAGWRAAYNKVTLPTAEVTNINSILIKTPPYEVDGAAESRSYIMSSYDNNHVDLETLVGENYVTVARIAHGKYNAGWAAAYGKVELPTTQVTNINSILIKTPPSTVDGAADSRSYIMSSYDNNNVDLQTLVGSNYVTVARITHGKYNGGWYDAYSKMKWPEAGTDTTMTVQGPASSPTATPDYQQSIYAADSDANYCYIKHGTIVMARKAQYFNKSGTLYYDSYEYSQGNFIYHYHQTISQQSQAIVTSGNRTVRWHV